MKNNNYSQKRYPMIVRMLFLTCLLLTGYFYRSSAQLNNYCFSATTGTYAYLSGGTAVNSIEADDVNATSIPIGFTFNYMGSNYTVASVSSNGWLSFTNGNPSAANSRTNSIATTNASLVNTVFPLWDDLNGAGAGIASYKLTGTAPDQIFTMEWRSWSWNYNTSNAVISFQVKLYQTTNVVEFWYKTESGAVTTTGSGYTSGASIGITNPTGGSGNYFSLNNSGASPTANKTTATDNIIVKPATNQVYRFAPIGFSTQPTAQAACSGGSVTFTSVAFGTPTPTYQWRKGGTNISGATSSSYTIPSAIAGDAGTYDVVITNSCTSVTSSGAALSINTPPSISVHPVSQTKCTGQSVTFSVTAAGSSPSYQWTKNGSNISGATSSSYTISSTVAGDAANYAVIVSVTGCSSVTSNVAVLTMNSSPSISSQPSAQTICVGNPVTFSVTGSGTPTPTYQWRKGGVDISGATSSSYNIPGVVTGDAATYTVVLTNSCSALTSNNAALTVNTPPSISTQPITQSKCVGQSVTFSVTAGGSSPGYQWQKGGTNISGATSSSYSISSVAAGDAANYRVVVSVNQCTSLNSNNAALTVNANPTVYAVTGGGAYCSGGAGVGVSIANSQTGVNYQLKLNGSNTGAPVGGTGSGFSFGNQTGAGTYTVDAVNATTACPSAMSGNASVIVNPLPASVSATANADHLCNGSTVTLQAAATTNSISAMHSDNFNGATSYSGSGTVTGNRSQIWGIETSGTTVNSAATFTSPNGGNTFVALAAASAVLGTSTSSASSTLISGAINTNNYSTINLSYNHSYKQGNSGTPSGVVEVSTDGTSWTAVKTYTSDQGGSTAYVADNIVLSATYLNRTSFKIRFVFTSNNSSFLAANASWWAVDDVLLNGKPLPLFTWSANTAPAVNGLPGTAGTALPTNNNVTASPSATVTYSVIITDAVTGCSASASPAAVNVHPIPAANITSVNTSICPGNSTNVTGTVSVGATDNWTVYLTEDGNTPLASGTGSGNFSIPVAPSADFTYSVVLVESDYCESTNATLSGSTLVAVNAAPTVTNPVSAVKCEGQSVTFSVNSTGTPAPAYQWRKDGSNISGANNNSYSIGSVLSADAGVYDVVVTNVCNVATSNTANLEVNTSAAITSNPVSATKCPGEGVLFTVSATGTPAPAYQWRKNGVDISGATSNSLNIPSVVSGDAGSYDVVVTNSCNIATSTTANLAINSLPAITSQPDLVQTICSGNTAIITAGATGSGLIYQWYKGATPLANGGRFSGVASASLMISSLDVTDAANDYHVVVSGACSPSVSSNNSELVVPSATALTGKYITSISDLSNAALLTACNNQVVQLKANGIAEFPGLQYSWSVGSNSNAMEFSNDGISWTANSLINNGNVVYVRFGAVANGNAGYRLCVKAITPCQNTINYCPWIQGTVNTPAFINGAKVVCTPSTQTYTCASAAGAATYAWTFNGNPLITTTTTNASLDLPAFTGTAQLCVRAALDCGPSSAGPARCITLTHQISTVGGITGGNRACPASTSSYSVAELEGATSYVWSVPSGATFNTLPGNGNAIDVTFPNPYVGSPSVCVTVSGACAGTVSTSRCKGVLTNTPSVPGAMTGPLAGICAPSTVNYSVPSVNGATEYLWTYPTGVGTSASVVSNNTFTFNAPSPFVNGTVSVVAVNTGCPQGGSSGPRTINIKGTPATPSFVTVDGTVCNGMPAVFTANYAQPVSGLTYAWLSTFGNASIEQPNPSPSGSAVITWGNGTGNVYVTASNICGNSGTLVQSFTGSNSCRMAELHDNNEKTALEKSNMSVYPNPAHHQLTVNIQSVNDAGYTVKLSDISGRVIFSENVNASAGINEHTLDVSKLPKGVYMMEVSSVVENWKTKVVIE